MPASGVPPAWRAQISDLIAGKMGLHFPPERWTDLEQGLSRAAREFGLPDAAACAEWLIAANLSQRQIEVLASHLTVGETYFFRGKKTFDILAERVLPELIKTRQGSERRLRIWSAACCTGEEAYSLAILLSQFPELAEWHVTILATDINDQFLGKARAGIYSNWSFRETPPEFKARYFRPVDAGRFALLPEIRKRVTFAHLNLVDDVFPSIETDTNGLDLIFCRNVLMYFTPSQARKVVANLHRALRKGAWLVVSPSECSHELFGQFSSVNFPGVVLYRKEEAKGAAISPAPVLPATAASWRDEWIPPLPLNFSPVDFAQAVAEKAPVAEPEKEPAKIPMPSYADAQALYEKGLYAEATEALLARMGSRDSAEPRDFSLLARAFANQGRLREALAWCERWLKDEKLDTSGHYLRAMILQELGEREEARRALQRTVYLDPGLVLGHFALGNLARENSSQAEADKHFTNALRLLQRCQPEEILPESEGLTAARLIEFIEAISSLEATS
ncbi:MCP methyltransferase, CheR-type with Tpr repeats [Chthoniobacter flavus Ellin428]|uniref:MCP methyltransferase, CheR-type with Tpr repeats n=1 Tax=Chthoniobacter flavus Ellin428 TaxID=497964 RepID=B4DC63_9BACT|nr:protein-glutamate O-methyltransferase CheR [Chthoniobacter flavus]EDY15985.1 MCP methyltransferase, CheR-type with Tpr repeats [Chthoniobacter flavus Ellin428]TCO83299.1 CheR-type MCP methyltransferase [Chthoniobacter flavus]